MNILRQLKNYILDPSWVKFWFRESPVRESTRRDLRTFKFFFRSYPRITAIARQHPQYRGVRWVLQSYLVFALLVFPFLYLNSDVAGAGNFVERLLTSGYFSVVTITTTGYGHIKPTTSYARAVACIEILTGLVLLVFVLPIAFAPVEAPDAKTEIG